MTNDNANGGKLYVVATPIGNLGDISQRALEVLNNVSLIAAEDTRHSGLLLSHFSINTAMVSLHDHNETQRGEELISRIQAGASIALISDAGTPLISDPGFKFVRNARSAHIPIVPIPGASALVTALSAAGLPSDRFAFDGFLPAKSGARRKVFETNATESRTQIYYESPRRLSSCLEDAVQIYGPDRRAVVARELTKRFETIIDGSLSELSEKSKTNPNMSRGEIVLLIEGADQRATNLSLDNAKLLNTLSNYLSPSDAARCAAELTGESKRDLYQQLLSMQQR